VIINHDDYDVKNPLRKIKQILMLPNAPIRYIVAVDITKNKIQDVEFYKNQLLKITNK